MQQHVALAKKDKYTIEDLIEIMRLLRDPENGCPWDLEQNLETLKRYTLEEAYEVCEAIDNNDMDELKEELGDLLLQIVFQSQIATEETHFNFDDITHIICDKMIRRHPHIFSDVHAPDSKTVLENWETIKKEEKKEKRTSAMDDIPKAFPALMRTKKIYKRAAQVGFVWENKDGALNKVREEIEELDAEVKNTDPVKMTDEFGDILFSMVCYGAMIGVDAETALTQANQKFEKRFRTMESLSKEDGALFENLDLDKMENYWHRAKQFLSRDGT